MRAKAALSDRKVVGIENVVALPTQTFIERLGRDILFGGRQIDAGLTVSPCLANGRLQELLRYAGSACVGRDEEIV